MPTTKNDAQRTYWSDQAGPKWVTLQQVMDAKMRPVLDGVLMRANLETGQRVLDIGSGTGQSTLAAAEQVGPSGHVLGADISDTMIALARKRAEGQDNIKMLLADAAAFEFEAGQVDRVISRFGVMFFADPVAAFANIAKAMKPGATLTMACWGQIPLNPYFTLPAAAARAVIGHLPKSDPDAPGPFAFRDPQRVLSILTAAGFLNAECEVAGTELTPPGSRREVAEFMSQIGPADAALTHFEADEAGRGNLIDAISDALFPYEHKYGVRIPAQINYFTANM